MPRAFHWRNTPLGQDVLAYIAEEWRQGTTGLQIRANLHRMWGLVATQDRIRDWGRKLTGMKHPPGGRTVKRTCPECRRRSYRCTDCQRAYIQAVRDGRAIPRPKGKFLDVSPTPWKSICAQVKRLDNPARAVRMKEESALRRRCDCGGIVAPGIAHRCGRTA